MLIGYICHCSFFMPVWFSLIIISSSIERYCLVLARPYIRDTDHSLVPALRKLVGECLRAVMSIDYPSYR